MTAERAPVEVLKVSATSKPVAVAGAIAGVIRSKGRVEVQAIGAGAINQAVKAIAISRGYVAPGGLDLVCIPAFIDISIDGEERTVDVDGVVGGQERHGRGDFLGTARAPRRRGA